MTASVSYTHLDVYKRQAKDSLQKAADRYFASVPFPEVERIVGKEMLKIYMKYIPAEQLSLIHILPFRFGAWPEITVLKLVREKE